MPGPALAPIIANLGKALTAGQGTSSAAGGSLLSASLGSVQSNLAKAGFSQVITPSGAQVFVPPTASGGTPPPSLPSLSPLPISPRSQNYPLVPTGGSGLPLPAVSQSGGSFPLQGGPPNYPPSLQTAPFGGMGLPVIDVNIVSPLPLPVTIAGGMPPSPSAATPPGPKEAQPGFFGSAWNWLRGKGPEPAYPTSQEMIGTGEKRGGTLGHFQAAGGRFMGAVETDSATKAMSESLKGMGSLLGTIPGPIGKMSEGLLKLGGKLIETVDVVKRWGESLHASNMQFAEFSASMSAVQANQMVRDIQLSMTRGERRAASAEYLAEGKSRLAGPTAALDDAFANVKNWMLGWGMDKIASILEKGVEVMKNLPGGIGAAVKQIFGDNEVAYDLEKALLEAEKRAKSDKNGRPNRHK